MAQALPWAPAHWAKPLVHLFLRCALPVLWARCCARLPGRFLPGGVAWSFLGPHHPTKKPGTICNVEQHPHISPAPQPPRPDVRSTKLQNNAGSAWFLACSRWKEIKEWPIMSPAPWAQFSVFKSPSFPKCCSWWVFTGLCGCWAPPAQVSPNLNWGNHSSHQRQLLRTEVATQTCSGNCTEKLQVGQNPNNKASNFIWNLLNYIVNQYLPLKLSDLVSLNLLSSLCI